MPYDYGDNDIIKAMGNGPDAQRKATYDQWLAQAKAGDTTALRKLYLQADPDGPGGYGAGTRDSRNYLRMILRDQGPLLASQGHDISKIGGYMEKGDGQFNLGKTLGSVLKVAAPIAGMAIPGLGTLGAMAVGAGGSAAGGALHGDKFNLGKTLAAGGAAAAGNNALGNGLGGGTTNLGFGSSPSIPKAPDISGMGDGTYKPGSGSGLTPGGVAGAAGQVAGAAGQAAGAAGGQGALGKLGGLPWDKIIGGGAALGGYLDARNSQKSSDAFNNEQLNLRKQQLEMAQKDYASREPLRTAAISRLGKMASGPIGSSIYGSAA